MKKILIGIYWSAIIGVGAFCVYCSLYSPPFNWNYFENLELSAKTPCKLVRTKSAEIKEGLTGDFYDCATAYSHYFIAILKSDNPGKSAGPDNFLDGYLEGMKKKEGTIIIRSKKIKVSGNPAKKFELKTVQDGVNVYSKGVIIWIEPGLAATAQASSDSDTLFSEYERFIRSINIR